MADSARPGSAATDGTPLRYRRILLKLSGEALSSERSAPFDFERIEQYSDAIKGVVDMGVQVGLVIGGGNIIRGAQLSRLGMDRVGADYMGMLGTVINALALQDVLERKGVDTRVMTAIRMEELAEPYIRRRALRHFEKGRTVIFAAGTWSRETASGTDGTPAAMCSAMVFARRCAGSPVLPPTSTRTATLPLWCT